MALIKGKQIDIAPNGITTANINANAVTAAKVASDVIIAAGTNPFTGNQSLGGNKITSLANGTAPTDAINLSQLTAAVAGITSTFNAQALSATNIISLSGLATVVDGFSLNTDGMIALLTAQAAGGGIDNGPWVVHAGAWTRPPYYANGSNSAGTFAFIENGTSYAGTGWLTVSSPDVVGTDPSIWTQFTAGQEVRPTPSNKNMAGSVTVADGNIATATAVALANVFGGYVGVQINGVSYIVGNGTKVGVDAYFSNDGGATARAFSAIAAGDTCRWNGSVAGFQLEATDKLNFLFDTIS